MLAPKKTCKRSTKRFKRDDNLLRHLHKVHQLSKEERKEMLCKAKAMLELERKHE